MASMLKIAICDDDGIICNLLTTILKQIEITRTLSFQIEIFLSGEDFEQYIRKYDQNFDVIFLDIEFPDKMSGVDIGTMIRKKFRNEFIKIIYVSNHSRYSEDLFKLHTFDFIKKPFYYDDIDNIIQEIILVNYKQRGTFEYKIGIQKHEIDLYKILYFLSEKRKIVIKTYKNDFIFNKFYGKISDISEKLTKMDFFLIHNYCLVNYYAVSEFNYAYIKLLNNEKLNISQPFRASVRNIQMEKMEKK
jgi:DNA-binding LytR/AlgR family response regulator